MGKRGAGGRAAPAWRKIATFRHGLFCGAAIALFALPAAAETLAEAMAYAYDTNPTLQAARAQLRATDENVSVAESGWRPTVSLNGDIAQEHANIAIPGLSSGFVIPTGTSSSTGTTTSATSTASSFSSISSLSLTTKQIGAQIDEPLFRGFKTVASIAQAEDQVQSQRAQVAATEAQVLLQVATAYLDVVQADAVLGLDRNQVEVLTRQLEAAQDRFRVGEITRTDVAQAEASLSGAKASVVEAEGTLAQARAEYLNVVGHPPEGLTAPAMPQELPANLDDAVDKAIHDNPRYLAADYSAKAAQEGIKIARSKLLPQADLVGQYLKAWDSVTPGSKEEVVVGEAVVTIPLYQQGAEWAELRQSKDQYGQARLQADQAVLDARSSAITGWENLRAATASQDSIKAQITANEVAFEGMQREAEVGSRTILDVLLTQQTLLQSRVDLVRNQHDQQVAAYQLLSAEGKLTASDLGIGVKLYDPVAHYNHVKLKLIGNDKDADSDAKR